MRILPTRAASLAPFVVWGLFVACGTVNPTNRRDDGGGATSSTGGTTAAGAGAGVSSGAVTSGGTSGSAGGVASGGTTSAAGSTGSSGSAGSSGSSGSSGGASAGGSAGSSGTSGSGGAPEPVGDCPGSCSNAAAGACTAPQVRITSVNLGSTLSYSTEESRVLPLAITAKPGGGSRIAWMTGYARYGSSTASQVHIADLDCDDELVGTPFTLEAYDFQDLAADGDGGVILLTRDAEGTGDQHCGNVDNLCFVPNDSPGCYDMYLVRHDCAGQEQWATKLTSSSEATPPYAVADGTTYLWWYQHHGRLAYDGENYAAYFGIAVNAVNNNSGNTCHSAGPKIDIHEADRMQVVGPTGGVLSGHDSFGTGCSHSWTTRIVWDERTGHFVSVCATDNNCRIARPPWPLTTVASGTCDGTLFGGDVVNAGGSGYWTAWSQGGTIRLEHFTTGASDTTISDAGSSQHPHLVSYGSDKMLLTWGSGGGMAAQVYNSTTGAEIGSQFSIDVPDHPWQAWKSYPDGSVAYAAVGSASSTIEIARVMPCTD